MSTPPNKDHIPITTESSGFDFNPKIAATDTDRETIDSTERSSTTNQPDFGLTSNPTKSSVTNDPADSSHGVTSRTSSSTTDQPDSGPTSANANSRSSETSTTLIDSNVSSDLPDSDRTSNIHLSINASDSSNSISLSKNHNTVSKIIEDEFCSFLNYFSVSPSLKASPVLLFPQNLGPVINKCIRYYAAICNLAAFYVSIHGENLLVACSTSDLGNHFLKHYKEVFLTLPEDSELVSVEHLYNSIINNNNRNNLRRNLEQEFDLGESYLDSTEEKPFEFLRLHHPTQKSSSSDDESDVDNVKTIKCTLNADAQEFIPRTPDGGSETYEEEVFVPIPTKVPMVYAFFSKLTATSDGDQSFVFQAGKCPEPTLAVINHSYNAKYFSLSSSNDNSASKSTLDISVHSDTKPDNGFSTQQQTAGPSSTSQLVVDSSLVPLSSSDPQPGTSSSKFPDYLLKPLDKSDSNSNSSLEVNVDSQKYVNLIQKFSDEVNTTMAASKDSVFDEILTKAAYPPQDLRSEMIEVATTLKNSVFGDVSSPTASATLDSSSIISTVPPQQQSVEHSGTEGIPVYFTSTPNPNAPIPNKNAFDQCLSQIPKCSCEALHEPCSPYSFFYDPCLPSYGNEQLTYEYAHDSVHQSSSDSMYHTAPDLIHPSASDDMFPSSSNQMLEFTPPSRHKSVPDLTNESTPESINRSVPDNIHQSSPNRMYEFSPPPRYQSVPDCTNESTPDYIHQDDSSDCIHKSSPNQMYEFAPPPRHKSTPLSVHKFEYDNIPQSVLNPKKQSTIDDIHQSLSDSIHRSTSDHQATLDLIQQFTPDPMHHIVPGLRRQSAPEPIHQSALKTKHQFVSSSRRQSAPELMYGSAFEPIHQSTPNPFYEFTYDSFRQLYVNKTVQSSSKSSSSETSMYTDESTDDDESSPSNYYTAESLNTSRQTPEYLLRHSHLTSSHPNLPLNVASNIPSSILNEPIDHAHSAPQYPAIVPPCSSTAQSLPVVTTCTRGMQFEENPMSKENLVTLSSHDKSDDPGECSSIDSTANLEVSNIFMSGSKNYVDDKKSNSMSKENLVTLSSHDKSDDPGECSYIDSTANFEVSNIFMSGSRNYVDEIIDYRSFLEQAHHYTVNLPFLVRSLRDTYGYKYFQSVQDCIIEIYNIPPSCRTLELLHLYHEKPRCIIWCDDSHALLITQSPNQAKRALTLEDEEIKSRTLAKGSPVATVIACCYDLQPIFESLNKWIEKNYYN